MKLLILSDTHGLVHEVKQVVERHAVDRILHCGDFCVDPVREPFDRMMLVQGNCDTAKGIPEERTSRWQGLTILQTHGHLFGVKKSLLRLHYRAEEVGANLVVFGHSHLPVCTVERGILFLNPGSLQLPRGFDVPTYAVLEWKDAAGEGIQVHVQYYDYKGNPESRLGGAFALRR